MDAIGYMQKAVRRVQSKGLINTATYSSGIMADVIEACFLDLRYGGKICFSDLKYHANNQHYHTMIHTSYRILRKLFDRVPLNSNDVLVDVGCGEGRVINFWLSRGLKNRIVGLEINPAVARRTRQRYASHRNVTILEGDAADMLPADGTVFFLYNPFSLEPMSRFAAAIKNARARIVYYIDNYKEVFTNDNWTIQNIGWDDGILEFRASLITHVDHPAKTTQIP